MRQRSRCMKGLYIAGCCKSSDECACHSLHVAIRKTSCRTCREAYHSAFLYSSLQLNSNSPHFPHGKSLFRMCRYEYAGLSSPSSWWPEKLYTASIPQKGMAAKVMFLHFFISAAFTGASPTTERRSRRRHAAAVPRFRPHPPARVRPIHHHVSTTSLQDFLRRRTRSQPSCPSVVFHAPISSSGDAPDDMVRFAPSRHVARAAGSKDLLTAASIFLGCNESFVCTCTCFQAT